MHGILYLHSCFIQRLILSDILWSLLMASFILSNSLLGGSFVHQNCQIYTGNIVHPAHPEILFMQGFILNKEQLNRQAPCAEKLRYRLVCSCNIFFKNSISLGLKKVSPLLGFRRMLRKTKVLMTWHRHIPTSLRIFWQTGASKPVKEFFYTNTQWYMLSYLHTHW